MVTFERIMQTFIVADVPDELMVKEIKIKHEKECIYMNGILVDNNDGSQVEREYNLPFYEDTDDNNDSSPIIRE